MTWFDIGFWLFVVCYGSAWMARYVMKRVSPRYAIKCQQRERKKRNRRLERELNAASRRSEREAKRRAQIESWATANPDDVFAKEYLARAGTGTPSSPVEAATSLSAALRDSQRRSEESRRWIEQQRAEAERQLEWAIANSGASESRYYLERRIEGALSDLRHVDTMVGLYESIVNLTGSHDDVRAIDYATQLTEQQARKSELELLIGRIQRALSDSSPASEK